jgi:hypothetical protein
MQYDSDLVRKVYTAQQNYRSTDSDEEDGYVPREDEWYYGEIPASCTYEDLILIMRSALIKYKENDSSDLQRIDMESILDRWLEHDSRRSDKFDHLVTEEKIEDFFSRAVPM